MIIYSGIESLRDPFVVVENGNYYVYGTGVDGNDWDNTMWTCYKNESGRLDGEWTKLSDLAVVPETARGNRWAPEVHKYKGKFYMFTTYYSTVTEHKGCTVLRADKPEGPFVEISNGHLTPSDWDCIDGTLYVAPDGTPWMVFVYEWSSTPDGIGRMAMAPMSDDLTRFTADPTIMFRADAAPWGGKENFVTDGCFMYTTKDGQLLMLWSNFDKDGYAVGVARSTNGRLDGEWTHDIELLFSKSLTNEYDGGHGMIFTGLDGGTYLALHSPNYPQNGHGERTVFVPIREENGRLITDI